MTLPDERYRAIRCARYFLYELVDPKKTPRVPKAIRNRAVSILKHYPNDYDLDQIVSLAPDVVATPLIQYARDFDRRGSK